MLSQIFLRPAKPQNRIYLKSILDYFLSLIFEILNLMESLPKKFILQYF